MVNGTLFTNGVGSTCATCDVCARSRVRGLRHEERRVATQVEVKKGDCVSAFPIPPDQAGPPRQAGSLGPPAAGEAGSVRAAAGCGGSGVERCPRVPMCTSVRVTARANRPPRAAPTRRRPAGARRTGVLAPARSRSPRITRSRACRSVARGGTPHRNTLDALLTHDGSNGIKWVDRENKTKHAKRIPPL